MAPEGSPALRIPPERKVLLCMGPGGVGKTTVSAALGLRLAMQGRKVIVVTIDPSRRLAQALGLDPRRAGGGAIVPVAAPGGAQLDCLLLDTRSVFDSLVRAYSADAASARAMLDNPIYRATTRHLGGAVEYAATARVHMLLDEGRHDIVVLDTPPTANAVEFLDAPGRIREVVSNPAARLLVGSGRIGLKILGLGGGVLFKTLEAMGGGGFLAQLGTFLREFGNVLGEFQRRAGDVEQLLRSRRTGTILTTAPTDFSQREAEAFLADLIERGLRVDGLVLNRVLASPTASLEPDDLRSAAARHVGADRADAVADELGSLFTAARAQSERGARILTELRARHPDLSVVALPSRDPPPTTLPELSAMGEVLLGG